MRICSLSVPPLKHEWNQTVWSVNNLRCGTAGPLETLVTPVTNERRLYRIRWYRLLWLLCGMSKQRFEKKAMDSLAALGFTVGSTRGVVRVEKYGCGAEFRQDPDGRFRMTVLPTIMLNGQFTRLWDAGYQKFLLTDEGIKIPALASHLEGLRKFNEELRTALGVPTFYNEALGSVSQLSVYDRVKGRPGDVPDTTVGCHIPASDH